MKHKIFSRMIALTLAFSLFGAALPAVVQANGDGGTWSPMTSNSTANLSGVWGSSSSDVFAVGSGGTILHYDGSTWSPMTSNTTESLRGVWGSSSTDVFAVGGSRVYGPTYGPTREVVEEGTILHYDGSTWSLMTSDITKYFSDVCGSSSTDVFAVGGFEGSTILHYDGNTWSRERSWIGAFIDSLWVSSPADIFAVGGRSPVYQYDRVPVFKDGTVQYKITGKHLLYYEEGTILHYDGAIWKKLLSSGRALGTIFLGVWGSSPSDVFAVGGGGTILHYDGRSVGRITSTTTESLSDVWGSSSTDVFAVGREGTIVHYDGGAWSSMTSGTTDYLGGVWGSSGSDVFAVGGDGTILHYGFTPRVNAVDIGSGNQGVTLDVVITGDHFTGATAVSFGNQITVNSFSVDSSTRITASISIAADAISGVGDVLVTTPAGTGRLAAGFTVAASLPTVTGVDIGSGNQGVTLDVVITGDHFTGTTAVSFGNQITVNSFSVDSSTQIKANVSIAVDAATGVRHVSVTTPAGTGRLAAGFTVAASLPTVTGVDIGSGNQGVTLDVVITGDHFTGTTAVSFGNQITVNSFSVDSSTQITASISIAADAISGAGDVLVTTPAGTGRLAAGFTVEEAVPAPTPPGGGLSCRRSPGPQASGLGDLALLLGVMFVCFGLTRLRRR